jgi:uncharacterized protein YbaR (Trm112 family)
VPKILANGGRERERFAPAVLAFPAAMAIDPELLEILVCPQSHGRLEPVELPEELRRRLAAKYREHFRDEQPVVEQGLYCVDSALVYPIVSGIPILLVDEALPASEIGR